MIVCVCVIENEIVRLSYHERVGVCVIETGRDRLIVGNMGVFVLLLSLWY